MRHVKSPLVLALEVMGSRRLPHFLNSSLTLIQLRREDLSTLESYEKTFHIHQPTTTSIMLHCQSNVYHISSISKEHAYFHNFPFIVQNPLSIINI